MIAPGARLLAVFVIAVPAPLLAAVAYPELGPLGWLPSLVLALLAATDAWAGASRLRGIVVELPPVTRLSCGRDETLEVLVRNPQKRSLRIRIGLALPSEVAASEDQVVDLPAGAERVRVPWPCRADRRGRFRLDVAAVEVRSPLGLWEAWARQQVGGELRAYPSLTAERKSAPALFLRRGAFGARVVRQAGRGRDFEKLREYIAGDGYDEIHWKATAKRGRPVTKVFQIERTQEIYVALDVSRLSARAGRASAEGRGPTLAIDRYINAALMLGLAAEDKADRYGLLVFSDRVERFVRARNGKAHYAACRDALYNLEARTVSPDFDEAMAFIRLRLRKRALILLLTSLDDPMLAESFLQAVELIRRQHLIVVGVLPPDGVEPLFSSPGPSTPDEIYQALGGHLRWHSLKELERTLRSRGIKLALLRDETLAADLISQYVAVRQRQLL